MPRGHARHQNWASDQLRVLQKLYEERYRFVIQKVPSSYNRPRGIKNTTCRHPGCPNTVTPPGSYRASLEKVGDCDPATNTIGYEAIDSVSNVKKTAKGSRGRRGLGVSGQEWWCLKCLEALFVDLRENVWMHNLDGSTLSVHPLTSIQYWIIPERRIIPQFGSTYYTLQSPQIHLLAKWQAVKTYDELRHRPAEGHFDFPEDPAAGPIMLYLGHDRESFYMDPAIRDMRGALADKRFCEIDVSDVRGYSLSESYRRLDKKEDRMVEEKWKPIMAERRRTAEEQAEGEGEGEGEYAEGQIAVGSEEPGESAEPKEPTGPMPPVSEGHKRALPVLYLGNDLPENNGKRKRCDLDQSPEPARRNTFLPSPLRSALAKSLEKAPQPRSASPSVPQVRGRQESTLPPTSITSTGAGRLPSSGASSFNPIHQSAKGGTRVDVNGGKAPLSLVPKPGLATFARPELQQFPPLKFAPKPTSRLCKRNHSDNSGVSTVTREFQQPGA